MPGEAGCAEEFLNGQEIGRTGTISGTSKPCAAPLLKLRAQIANAASMTPTPMPYSRPAA